MIVDALSRQYTLLSQLDYCIFGLESIKEQYALDPDFKDVMLNCREGCTWNKFVVNDGFCLVHFCQEQDAVLRLWNPNRELNQLLSVIWLLLRALACVLRFAGKSKLSWRGRPTAAWLITIGFMVLSLWGSALWI